MDHELAGAHSPGGSTFLHEMATSPPSEKLGVKSKIIRLRRSMRIYSKNIPAEFHHDPIGNDGEFFEERRVLLLFFYQYLVNKRCKKNKNSKTSSDMRSVSGPSRNFSRNPALSIQQRHVSLSLRSS